MRCPSAAQLLAAWECGLGQAPAERGLTLLRAAAPEAAPLELARLSIGQRDSCLLSLREQAFGTRMQSLTTCPRCAERLELSLDAQELHAEPTPEPPDAAGAAGGR